MAVIKMRVKEGKRPLPYNDGYVSALRQPLEVFEGPEQLIAQFPGHLEALDESGNVVEASPIVENETIMRARPHERVTMLESFKQRRVEAQQQEIAALDTQIEQAKKDADREANEKRAERGQPVATEGGAQAAKVEPAQPEVVRDGNEAPTRTKRTVTDRDGQ